MPRTSSGFRDALKFSLPVVLLLSSACSIQVQKEKNGNDKQVDISTPVGGIHVSDGANPQEVGISIYPGARMKIKDSDGDDKSANVDISGLGYGLRVVALEYESDDSPAKVVDYYKNQLTKYGDVLICHTTHRNVMTDVKTEDEHSRQLTCEGSAGANVELKVGTKDNQHIVAVEPEGKGSTFSLVYVRTHGKKAEL
jgi:hypothetical protein